MPKTCLANICYSRVLKKKKMPRSFIYLISYKFWELFAVGQNMLWGPGRVESKEGSKMMGKFEGCCGFLNILIELLWQE